MTCCRGVEISAWYVPEIRAEEYIPFYKVTKTFKMAKPSPILTGGGVVGSEEDADREITTLSLLDWVLVRGDDCVDLQESATHDEIVAFVIADYQKRGELVQSSIELSADGKFWHQGLKASLTQLEASLAQLGLVKAQHQLSHPEDKEELVNRDASEVIVTEAEASHKAPLMYTAVCNR